MYVPPRFSTRCISDIMDDTRSKLLSPHNTASVNPAEDRCMLVLRMGGVVFG